MFDRALSLPPFPHSFFLWGPRLTGKSTLLRQRLPDARWYDLLESDLYARLLAAPHLLREEVLAWIEATPAAQHIVVLDEIQKLPHLLDEVHWLLSRTTVQFALCGSSARKLRRGHANLLGGRALRVELYPLTTAEVPELDLERALNHGLLPLHYEAGTHDEHLRAYIGDYLREEIAAEALIRNLPAFTRFLEIAALGDTQLLSYATIARECGVSAPTVKEYFQILEDTMLGASVPAYRARPKRRVTAAPKWYFFDAAAAGMLAHRGEVRPGGELFGKAFENFIHHELRAYASYSGTHFEIAYWRTASGVEVDFVLGTHQVAVEAKATRHAQPNHLRGLRSIADEYTFKERLLVSLDTQPRRLEERILVLPWRVFCERLWAGEII